MRNYVLGNRIVFDILKREIVSPELNISLGGRESEILKLLCLHANEVIDKTDIHEKVWGKVLVSETSLTKAISNLRKALTKFQALACEIKTIPKEGYMLICEGGATFESSSVEAPPLVGVTQINNEKNLSGITAVSAESDPALAMENRHSLESAMVNRGGFITMLSTSILASIMTSAIVSIVIMLK